MEKLADAAEASTTANKGKKRPAPAESTTYGMRNKVLTL